jgi:hypothetical protein
MKEPWMKQATIYYGKVTAWIFVPVVVAAFLARATGLGDAPAAVVVLIITSFALSIFGIFRSISAYKKTLK